MKLKKWLFFLSVSLMALQQVRSADSQKYYLSIASMFRDEARFLKEWIEFHHMLGVEHFYLINHCSKDDYQSVLRPYIEKGIVTVEEWHNDFKSKEEWSLIREDFLKKIIKEYGPETKWLTVIDPDEFLFPIQENHLPDFLHEYEEFAAVCVNWFLYGTSNVKRIPNHALLIEMLTLRAKDGYGEYNFYKSIVQPRYVTSSRRPKHSFNFYPPYYQVDENKNKVVDEIRTTCVNAKKIRINHYWTRDEEYFWKHKVKKNIRTVAPFIKWRKNFNIVQDKTIFRFVKPLKERLDFKLI